MTDITVYLPDAIGEPAKLARLPFSRLLRTAVVAELARRRAHEEWLDTRFAAPSTYDGER